jgi:hypothetical protein
MSYLLIFFLGLFTFVGILAIIGWLSPKEIHVESSRHIKADVDKIFVQMADFENFVKWNPWAFKDPNMTNKFEGEKMSFGSKYSWKGNRHVGTGSIEIIHIEANKRLEMELKFGPGRPAKAAFILIPDQHGTSVTWSLDSNMGSNPFSRVVGRMMKKYITKDFDFGLKRLDEKITNE